MFSQLLLQIDATWPTASPVVLTVLIAGLVFFGGHYLMRLRHHHAAPPTPRRDDFTREDAIEERVNAAARQSPMPVLVTDAKNAVEPVPGYVISRSTNGLVIELDEEGQVDAGTFLNVRPTHADELVPWVLVEVRHCRTLKSTWQLDCRYVRTPPYSIRMLFG